MQNYCTGLSIFTLRRLDTCSGGDIGVQRNYLDYKAVQKLLVQTRSSSRSDFSSPSGAWRLRWLVLASPKYKGWRITSLLCVLRRTYLLLTFLHTKHLYGFSRSTMTPPFCSVEQGTRSCGASSQAGFIHNYFLRKLLFCKQNFRQKNTNFSPFISSLIWFFTSFNEKIHS